MLYILLLNKAAAVTTLTIVNGYFSVEKIRLVECNPPYNNRNFLRSLFFLHCYTLIFVSKKYFCFFFVEKISLCSENCFEIKE